MLSNAEYPSAWTPLTLARRFTAAEYERLAMGGMNDKWFVYLERDTLYFHRYWTGICIYKVRLAKVGDEYEVAEAVIGAPKRHTALHRVVEYLSGLNPWRRPERFDYDHADLLNLIIDIDLLGKPDPRI